ncbi:S8 family serine peptidase [Auraticoccus monumenti]|uniref:Serine protease, subtilisin family n=1 Tax=Auraticoccus monumenti TaxID=675864 RepID=A0A1G6SSR2_9ACTN|nr:S8 family serine peptidase [Auraticoccus monumenti]SDD19681.1 Serine protease, subtilisin family [Auraticoccus monumenti]
MSPLPRPSRRATRAALALLLAPALLLGLSPAVSQADEPAERYLVRAESRSSAERISSRSDGQPAPRPRFAGRTSGDFTVELTAREADRLADQPGIERVVKDVQIRLTPATVSAGAGTSAAVPWGLDRIDQRSRTLDGAYTTRTTGEGVVVAVVDSGINAAHQDFTDRVLDGYDYFSVDETPEDCNGHGTHVAGTAAGSTYGAAPDAWVLPLRVFDCNGDAYLSDVLYAFQDLGHYARSIEERVVVNFSGGVYTGGLDADGRELVADTEAAISALYDAGAPVVTAAGNEDTDACSSSPGRFGRAINVAASDRSDRRAPFSDQGRCVDLFAPGVGIRSAWKGSTSATATLDGTSMAAPHVTGVVARFLEREPRASSGQVWGAVRDLSTWDVVADRAGSPNRLVYSDVRFAAPGAPTSTVLTTDHAAKSVLLTWKAPLRDNGRVVTGYRVTRSGTDSRGRGPESVLVPKGELNRTFRYLVPGRSYTFTVAAVNAIGTGKTVSKTTTVVAAPSKVAKPVVTSGLTTDTATSIKVDWSKPSGGAPTRYLVTVRRTSDGGTKTVEVAAPTTWVKVTGLSRGKTYTATVRAVNVAGTSATSTASGTATAR